MLYGIDMQLNHILEESGCTEIVERQVPGVIDKFKNNEKALALSLRLIAHYTHGMISDHDLEIIDSELKKYGQSRNWISPREEEKIKHYRQMLQDNQPFQVIDKGFRQDAIYPGKVWLDTKGEAIQAHAGGIWYEKGKYYWYGENKEYTTVETDIWSWGIRVYESTDLVNWTDLGLLIAPDVENPNSNLFPDRKVDRPHIIQNPNNGQFICWIKISGPESCFAILTAEQFLGPYLVQKEYYNPLGYNIGDFDLVIDDNGQGYLIAECDHLSTKTFLLSDDFLEATKVICESYQNLLPPFCREGTATMTYKGKKYLFTSGMTGYIPNQSDLGVTSEWNLPFQSIGDPHVNDESLTSFNSQIGQIFKVPNTELYIALADRWLPDYFLNREQALAVRNTVASATDPDNYSVTEEEKRFTNILPVTDRTETKFSTYVWLPITFEGERPCIHWRDEWHPLDFM